MAEYKKESKIIQTTAFPPKAEWRKGLTPATQVYDNPKQLDLFERVERGHGSGPSAEAIMRYFESGATRNVDENKLRFDGFLSPIVLRRFAEYMHKHRKQADGELRAPDNWQKGIPKDAYLESAHRHFHDWWSVHRGYEPLDPVPLEEAICALLFNTQGYLHELLKERGYGKASKESTM